MEVMEVGDSGIKLDGDVLVYRTGWIR